ncbi:hypothetical protein BH10PSE13_BH10PSE13_17680 [soil metagenome]
MASFPSHVAPRQSKGSRFYLAMAVLFIALAFGGFIPTYWLRIASGSFRGPPIFHVHGLLFFAWTIFYFFQVALVASGRTPNHRACGMAGISLFSVMMCSVVATRITSMKIETAAGFAEAGRRFAIFNAFDLFFQTTVFALAIIQVRRPEIHKRLMILLNIAIIPPAIARIFLAMLGVVGSGRPPPVAFGLAPNLVANLLLLLPVVHDWKTTGRVHPVYIYGGAILVIGKMLIVPFAATDAWLAIATAVEGLAG